MTIDYGRLRIEGVYKQTDDGHLMMRIKVPAGVLSSEQALVVGDIADRHADGRLHLTTRGSLEIHWLQHRDLAEIHRRLAAVGLTSRGACGGAVRGIACSTTFADGFTVAQVLARKLHRHLAGNPHFEGLPKKFKISVDAGYQGSRHLIQDLGLVYAGSDNGIDLYDIWTAGGLGREPVEAFLFERSVPEPRILPTIEAVVHIYRQHTPAGKRLKHLLQEIGEKKFRLLVGEHLEHAVDLPLGDAFEKRLSPLPPGGGTARVEAVVFAGELTSQALRELAAVARDHAGGFMAVTADQNIAFLLEIDNQSAAEAALAAAGFSGATAEEQVTFRICPGNHECRLGLAPTRDVARAIAGTLDEGGKRFDWAISGCPNSCAQPQLAAVGIIAVKSLKDAAGERHPLFDLYRRQEAGFGRLLRRGLNLTELLQAVADLQGGENRG
jgi:sulfite reductase beta subunit-like hemoprotein